MKIGFLFPGQGAQALGMGKDLYDSYSEYKEIYDKVKILTSIDIAKITFGENEAKLNETKYTQLAILTMSMAVLKLMEKENIKAEASMGLSLGEYSSLIYSKKISLEDGIKVVQKRGKLMQELCPEGDWLMSAIIGLEEEKLRQICEKVKSGFVTLANFNCIGQIAISGEKKAVEEASNLAKGNGARKVVFLKTSGPFHTKMLQKASEELEKELKNIKFNKFETKVIKNIDGKIYSEEDNLPDILSKHIVNPVRFTESIETMLNLGIDTFIELGPRKNFNIICKKS